MSGTTTLKGSCERRCCIATNYFLCNSLRLSLTQHSSQSCLRPVGSSHSDWVRDVAWRPGPRGCDTLASGGEDGKVLVWRKPEGSDAWETEVLGEFGGPVWRVSWSVTGTILAVSQGDDAVSLWEESDAGGWERVKEVEKGADADVAS